MTRYLFTTLPTNDLGLLTRSLPIARELAALGHSIVFCSPAKAPRRLISDAGFENLTPKHPIYELIDVDRSFIGLVRFFISRGWKHHDENIIQFLQKLIPALPIRSPPKSTDVWNMDQAGAVMGMLNEGFVRANCEAFRCLIETSGADVIVDFWNPFAVIAARAIGKPVVTVIQANAHPDSGGFLWWETPPPDLPTPVSVVNRVLGDYGLAPVKSLADLSVGDLTLVVGMPETDPLPDTANVNYIGSVLWQDADARLPEWIDALSKNKPLIWVYSGNPRYSSSSEDLDSVVVLHACKEALAREEVHVVLTTGHHPLPDDLLPLPDNFRYAAYLPGLLMARRSDLLIHHGGYGSCQAGLDAGKPAVIIPTYSERLGNARRLAAAGAAEIVRVNWVSGKKQVRPDELRSAVRHVLANAAYTESARRLAEELRSYGGAPKAAQMIEAFTEERRSK